MKNSEIVEENSVFKEEESISENVEAAGKLLTDPDHGRNVRLISETMTHTQPTDHGEIVQKTPDLSSEPTAKTDEELIAEHFTEIHLPKTDDEPGNAMLGEEHNDAVSIDGFADMEEKLLTHATFTDELEMALDKQIAAETRTSENRAPDIRADTDKLDVDKQNNEGKDDKLTKISSFTLMNDGNVIIQG